MITKDHLKVITERAIKNKDVLLFKFIKNVVIFTENEETH